MYEDRGQKTEDREQRTENRKGPVFAKKALPWQTEK
jgi:hypothetical protein